MNTQFLTASEFDWKISNEKTVRAWGFNGSIPGPVIKAKKGETLRVVVKNELNQPTLIHWHGIQLPANMDGTDSVQEPIQPGETFEYEFMVPDAGTFWYHSHHNETEQMERGMYGALIVEEDPTLSLGMKVDADRVFMIDDMKLDENSDFKKGSAFSRWKERHDGREGDTILINGREDQVISMNAGQVERWRFINASSARYVRLSLGGKKFRIIATDGGYLEKAIEVEEILLTPGERYDILAGAFEYGECFSIESLAYNRMTFKKTKRVQLATIVVEESKDSDAFVPSTLRTIERIAEQDATITRKIKFSVGPSLKRGMDFLVNGKMHTNDENVKLGELQVWEIANTSLMDHPFHLHGFFFQVLEVNGKAPAYLAWKDTINLPPRSKVKIAWMPDREGSWMYHCHILEHHAAGMMAHFNIQSGVGSLESGVHHHHHAH